MTQSPHDEAMTLIASVQNRRAAAGLKVVVQHEHGTWDGYAKDAAQAEAWRASARKKGWLVIE